MKKFLRRSLCWLLSIILMCSTFVYAVAADNESQTTTPVVVINDINANPIYNTDDGTVILDLRDYEYDLLFASGFSSEFANIIGENVINGIINDNLTVSDMATVLLDAFGFSNDINRIVNSVLDIAIQLLGSADISNLDISTILSSIDLQSYFTSVFNEIKADIALLDYLEMNTDGTPLYANTGAILHVESLEYYYDTDYDFAYSLAGEIGEGIAEAVGYENTYVFNYDWRIDPAKNAQNLDSYINNLKSATGADKVSVISEGYGSVIATEYLAEYENAASGNIQNFVTVSSEFLGTSLIGDFFKGDIAKSDIFSVTEYTSAYVRYTNDLSDNPITAFIMWLLNYIMNTEWEAQDFCMDIADTLNAGYAMLKMNGVLDQLSYMPGLWALVPADDFDKSIENMFGNDEIDNKLYDSICEYKDNQEASADILINAKDSGINISVVAAWDMQIMPIGQNLSVQSDGVVDTAYASFGATCIALNDVAYAMLAEQENEDGHDHMSANYDMLTPWYSYGGACYYIDASTCALPENTWFIKDMKHGTFNMLSNSINLLVWLVTSESECTVWQDASYKQFMTYNRYIIPGVLMSDGFVIPDAESTPGKYLLGDVNLDGIITALDSRLAARVADGTDKLEAGSIQFMNADTDADGVITDYDAQFILDMSTGIVKEYSIGIKTDADNSENGMIESTSGIGLTPYYNSVKNRLELTVSLVNAADTYAGNFVITYDEAMLTYSSVDCAEIDNVFVSAGQPYNSGSVLTLAYSTSKAINASQCDENSNLTLATFYLDVSRTNVTATSLSAGSTYFYENGSYVYVTPVVLDLNEDFFIMYGDADNNRYISPADARYTLRVSAKLESTPDDLTFIRCDVNKDGIITPADARLILRASASLIDTF